MGIDYASVYAEMYTLVAEDSGVLATLGANGLMSSRNQLKNLTGRVLPWLVWTYGPVSGGTGRMGDTYANWWAYCSTPQGERPLYRIAAAVEAVYKSERGLAISGGRLYIGPLSQPTEDTALGAVLALQIPVYYRALR